MELITGKWNLTSSSEYNSLELTPDQIYIIDKVATVKSTQSGSEFLSGTFTVSVDGTTITLDDFGTMTISEVSDSSIVISVELEDGTTLDNWTCEEEDIAVSDLSEKTLQLCNIWKTMDYESTKNCGINPTWYFSEYGTLLVQEKSSDSTSCSFDNYAYTWNWKDIDNGQIQVETDSGAVVWTINRLADYELSLMFADSTEIHLVDNESELSDAISGTTWYFTYPYTYNDTIDATWYADVTFYEDGTAFYTEEPYAATTAYDSYGTWSVSGDTIFYNLFGTPDSRSYIHLGEINGGEMSGWYSFGDTYKTWSAVEK